MAAWLALMVSTLVLLVSYSQWRTANQKVVVDLYERRLKIFEAFRDVVVEIVQTGEASQSASTRFWRVQADAEFLFGDDVVQFLKGISSDIIWLQSLRTIGDLDPKRAQMLDKKDQFFMRINDALGRASEVFKPYIRLTHRNTPFWRPW